MVISAVGKKVFRMSVSKTGMLQSFSAIPISIHSVDC